MKRKRGKKGKSKKASKPEETTEQNVNNLSLSADEESSPDDTEKDETNSIMDIETPSIVPVQPEKPPPPPVVVIDKPVGRLVYNRVKVKIKPSKALEPQLTSSDAPARVNTETDKTTQVTAPEKQLLTEKLEDSAYLLPETNVGVSVTQPKKAGSIKIKSSKGFSSSLSPCSNAGVPQPETSHPKEPDLVSLHPQAEKTHPKKPEQVSRNPQAETTHPKEQEQVSRHPQAETTHPKEPEPVSRHPQAETTHPKGPEPVSRHTQAETTHPKGPEPVSRHTQAETTHPKEPSPVSRYPQAETIHPKEPEQVSRVSVYNKQELITSLEVIKKIMKMEASEPFNVPVNPVALGIPDYFDVIKTPMDFGTICSNLESGVKYMNSEDVYKDVVYIWENCYKYNNKGDYIMELMKRVKKNFSKYWTAAGLYSEQQQGDMKDGNISSQGKSSSKSGNLKNKSRKRHGAKRHKDDCMCAICIMVRRRQEREHIMNPGDNQIETSDGLVQEVKPEGTSAMGTPNGDDSSSSTDNSQNEDADTEMDVKGGEVKLEREVQSTLQSKQQEEKKKETPPHTHKEVAVVEQFQVAGISRTEKDRDTHMADAVDVTMDDTNNEERTKQRKDETVVVEYQKPKELLDAGAKAKLYKNLHQRYDNPMVLELCSSLFPQNPKSIWSRHHSLVNRPGTSRNSSIGAAIATFIKH